MVAMLAFAHWHSIKCRLQADNRRKGHRMTQIGYVLSHEQFRTPHLLDFSVAAERAGFDMLWTSF